MIKLFDGFDTLLLDSDQILEIKTGLPLPRFSSVYFKGLGKRFYNKKPGEIDSNTVSDGTYESRWDTLATKEEIEKMIADEKYLQSLEKLL